MIMIMNMIFMVKYTIHTKKNKTKKNMTPRVKNEIKRYKLLHHKMSRAVTLYM